MCGLTAAAAQHEQSGALSRRSLTQHCQACARSAAALLLCVPWLSTMPRSARKSSQHASLQLWSPHCLLLLDPLCVDWLAWRSNSAGWLTRCATSAARLAWPAGSKTIGLAVLRSASCCASSHSSPGLELCTLSLSSVWAPKRASASTCTCGCPVKIGAPKAVRQRSQAGFAGGSCQP